MSPANTSDLSTPAATPIVANATTEAELDTKIDRLDELVSFYFDDGIADHEVTELEGLLFADESNLKRYVDHARLHADLVEHFNPRGEASLQQVVFDLAAHESR
ncbi:MAG: hypothetical protein AAFV43_15675 [Planctomycetota bacterium]